MIQGFPEISKYKVMVQCCTYNQSQYIEDTLKGFAMQQTNFLFVCCVFDDVSTDGEQEVLKHWIKNHCNPETVEVYDHHLTEIYIAPDKDTPNCIYAIHLQKVNTYGKPEKQEMMAHWEKQCEYIALCEGDDYWIDPMKLQKQVDFLDKHHDYVLCHTDFNLTSGKPRYHYSYKTDDDNFFPYSIYHDLGIGTLTTLYRREVFDKIPQLWKGQGWPMGDMPLWIELSHEGKFKRMPIATANYRILSNSASHGDLKKEIRFLEAIRKVKLFYANYYGLKLSNDGYTSTHYAEMIKVAFKHKNEGVAKMYKKEAVARKLTSFRFWFYYYAIIIKPFGYVIRNLKGR